MLSPLGEGTRRAALRWLAHLRVADVPRVQTLFTHHPRYADLTPAQYADGLSWLMKMGLVTGSGRPVVDISEWDTRDMAATAAFPHILRDAASDEAMAEIGAAGERAILVLLSQAGLKSVRHVALISDAYGYDIEAALPSGEQVHLEIKSTTDPTRLLVHLTRHECEVMEADTEWMMGAVLVGANRAALSVATVSRRWLLTAVPQDRSPDARWESARIAVPPHALTPGLTTGAGLMVLTADSPLASLAWGMQDCPAVPA